MKRKLYYGFLLVLLTIGYINLNAQTAVVKNVIASEFKKIVEKGNGTLVDVRTPAEFNMGHIKGAVLINFYDTNFKSDFNALNKNKPVYIYCRSGNRSSKAVGILKDIGFKEIVNLQYGIIDWQRNGFSLTQ